MSSDFCTIRRQGAMAYAPVCLAATVCLAGCGAPQPGPGAERATVRDSAGIEIVENRGSVWGETTPWRVSTIPTLRIGAVEGSPAEEFSRVTAVTRLTDGRVVVLEEQAAEVRYFDASGAHTRTAGGKGEGPGEFDYVGQMIRLPGDSILVEDIRSTKLVTFGPDGELARESLFDRPGYEAAGGGFLCESHLVPDRSRIGCVEEPGNPTEIREANGRTHYGPGMLRTFSRFVWTTADFSNTDTLGLYGELEQFGADTGAPLPEYIIHPFYSRTRTALAADGRRFFIAVNPEYSIEVWASTGELVHIIRRMDGRRAPSDAARQAAWESARRYVRDDVSWNRARTQIPEPDSVPAVASMVAGPGAELWVARRSTPEWQERPHEFDVFDPDGVFLGVIVLPDRFHLYEVGTDYLLGITADDRGVPFVELYALDRSGG